MLTIYRFIFIILMVVSGCMPLLQQPMMPTSARVGSESDVYRELTQLPEPREKIVAAVYKFRDQTGQYKPSETGASWSTAVTQGATSILQRAMEESGWFVTIEREGLSNLLNERKIIRSSRQAFGQEEQNAAKLPPLLFAGVLLEGGIISYDANTLTGGAGARYFGAGGSAAYRQDRVTVYLRATSTSNGRILKTVYTSRTILSQKVDAGLFRFVSFQRLLEAETGFTHNEPAELAVREAIEKALISLIVEGLQDGLWQLKNEEDWNLPVINRYQHEEEISRQSDYLGRRYQQVAQGRFSLGVQGGTFRYAGDYAQPGFEPAGELFFAWHATPWLSTSLNLGQGILSAEQAYRQSFFQACLQTIWKLSPRNRFSPYLRLGGGLISENYRPLKQIYPLMISGLGGQLALSEHVSLLADVRHYYTFTDELDKVEQGKWNDFFWSAHLGIAINFGTE